MAAWRQALELTIEDEDLSQLRTIAGSRTQPAGRVERARMLLAYREEQSFFAVGRALDLHHQTVQRCVERAVAYGPLLALFLPICITNLPALVNLTRWLSVLPLPPIHTKPFGST